MQNQGSNRCNTVASTAATVPFLLSAFSISDHFSAFSFSDHFVQLTLFAELSGVAGQADAGEGVDSIQTGGSIQAWIGLALVDVCRGPTTQTDFIPPRLSVSMGSIMVFGKRMSACVV